MKKEKGEEVLENIKLAYNKTTEKASNIGDYTDRSFKEAVLANQATIMAILAEIVNDMIKEEADV